LQQVKGVVQISNDLTVHSYDPLALEAARLRPSGSVDLPRPPRPVPDFALERSALASGMRHVAGIDEAGRGPWAGPVVAAAVILDPDAVPEGLDDSKALTARRRAELLETLERTARIGIGVSTVREIEEINILRASLLAMRRALTALGVVPCIALVDGNQLPPDIDCNARAIVGGDARSASIAAASIVAKVTRDRIMVALAQHFPGYGWNTNMGYGTSEHRSGLEAHGVTQHHRRTFLPIHNILSQGSEPSKQPAPSS
jgi:ribonuclease HII